MTALPCSGGYHLDRSGMSLHDAVGINVKRAQLLKVKAAVSSLWAKGCMLMIVCVICLDMTTPPWWREKVMVCYYYYYSNLNETNFLSCLVEINFHLIHYVNISKIISKHLLMIMKYRTSLHSISCAMLSGARSTRFSL